MRHPRVVEWSSEWAAGKARSGFSRTQGARLIDSTPPATITSASPHSIARAAWIVDLLGLIYVADLLRRAWVERSVPQVVLLVLTGALLVSPSDFVPLEPIWTVATLLLVAGLAASRWLPRHQRRNTDLLLTVLAVLTVLGFAGLWFVTRRLWQFDLDDGLKAAAMIAVLLGAWGVSLAATRRLPARAALAAPLAVLVVGAFLVRGSTDWLYQARHRGGLASAAQFQEWARTQTPVDSVFLILPSEPNNDNFYMNADRALYLVRERANQAVYFPAHNEEFRGRVEGLGVSNVLRYREEMDQAYRRLTEERIRDIAARYKVTHFVPARAGDFSFPVVYREGGWTVYEVRPDQQTSR